MPKLDKQHIIIAVRTLLIQAGIFVSIVFIMWGSQKLYALCDTVRFPEPMPATYEQGMSEEQKGVALLDALTNRMRYEMDSAFGWSANDYLFNKYVMDNRAYRQFGTYVATKMLLDHYSTVIAKLGNNDRENNDLYAARLNNFAISPSRWGYFFIPSAEGNYETAFKLCDKYKADLLAGKAVYNCRTDDIYSAFNLILGETVFGYALGLLQNTQDMPFYTLDNKIYEAQGVMLVVRDYLNALYTLYPEITAKGNEANMQAALHYLNLICDYDPLYITSYFNSGELIISYLLFARNRISDIRDSIRI
ncbi:MAG: DUF2333 family protein [Mailhella sp.]|nr:DUF2333 family protein [Mailhella sp.]